MPLKTNKCCCCPECTVNPGKCCSCICNRVCFSFYPLLSGTEPVVVCSVEAEFNQDSNNWTAEFLCESIHHDFRLYFERNTTGTYPGCWLVLEWEIAEQAATGTGTVTVIEERWQIESDLDCTINRTVNSSVGALTVKCAPVVYPRHCSGCRCLCHCLCVAVTVNAVDTGCFEASKTCRGKVCYVGSEGGGTALSPTGAQVCWEGDIECVGVLATGTGEATAKPISVCLVPESEVPEEWLLGGTGTSTALGTGTSDTCWIKVQFEDLIGYAPTTQAQCTNGSFNYDNIPLVQIGSASSTAPLGTGTGSCEYYRWGSISIRCAQCDEDCDNRSESCPCCPEEYDFVQSAIVDAYLYPEDGVTDADLAECAQPPLSSYPINLTSAFGCSMDFNFPGTDVLLEVRCNEGAFAAYNALGGLCPGYGSLSGDCPTCPSQGQTSPIEAYMEANDLPVCCTNSGGGTTSLRFKVEMYIEGTCF